MSCCKILVILLTTKNYYGEKYVSLFLLTKEVGDWKMLAKASTGCVNHK